MLKLSAYGALAQFWTSLSLKDEIWEEDAKNLLLLQKTLIEEFTAVLEGHLDEASMKRFKDYTESFKVRIVFGEDKKAKPLRRK
jgi:hypothetical protein